MCLPDILRTLLRLLPDIEITLPRKAVSMKSGDYALPALGVLSIIPRVPGI